jgi:hypothetical protein
LSFAPRMARVARSIKRRCFILANLTNGPDKTMLARFWRMPHCRPDGNYDGAGLPSSGLLCSMPPMLRVRWWRK